jgi:hypothetical protein
MNDNTSPLFTNPHMSAEELRDAWREYIPDLDEGGWIVGRCGNATRPNWYLERFRSHVRSALRYLSGRTPS